MRARGTFEVDVKPLDAYAAAKSEMLGRSSIDKRFAGDLEATSRGEMLSAGTDVAGSAGYVAIERVEGSLAGRLGAFILQHSGILTRGEPSLSITVVPDSGTGDLAGLSGTMSVEIADGRHGYTFEYELPER